MVVDHTEQLPRTSVMMEVFWLNQQGLVRMERGQEVNQAVGCLQVSRPTVSILDRIILHDVTLNPIMVTLILMVRYFHFYVSRRSRTRDKVKLTVC